MNQTTIAGHLGADPEVRFTSSGKKVTTLRVATKARRSGKDETIWWRVSIWSEEFDKMLTFFKKGSAIIVVGELNKPEIFTDKEGKPQISMSMTGFNIMFSPFGTGKAENSSQDSPLSPSKDSQYGMMESASYGQAASTMGSAAFSEDEIPF